MNRNFLIGLSMGAVCVVAAVVWTVYIQRGAHIDLPGKVLKVRTVPLDEGSSVAVLDFRVSNPADYPFVVRTVTVSLEDNAGNRTDGTTISETDAKRMFELMPLLGQKYNATLVMRDRIPPHTAQDRMVSARFEMPESRLESRKRLVVQVEEVDGKIVEFSDK
jgi:hypothetical protein